MNGDSNMRLLTLFFFPLLMAVPISSDLTTMRIPNWIPAALVGGNLLISLWLRLPLTMIALNFSCGATVLALAAAMFSMGWIGGGDAKLAAAIGVWVGWSSILDYGLAASIFGGLLTVVILVSRALPLPPRWPAKRGSAGCTTNGPASRMALRWPPPVS